MRASSQPTSHPPSPCPCCGGGAGREGRAREGSTQVGESSLRGAVAGERARLGAGLRG